MRIRRLIPLLALILIPAGMAAAQPAPGPYPPTKVAICSPARAFDNMAETKALRAKLEVRRKELVGKEQEMRSAIEQLVEQLKNTNPKHPKAREIKDAIDSKKAELQAWGMATKASVDRDQKEMVKDLYDKIEVAVGEVAQKRGIDLVIADGRQDIANVDDIAADELRRLLNNRNVLFSTKAVDITEEVITLLDAKFAQGAPAVPPALPK